jgi:hypothetical protein
MKEVLEHLPDALKEFRRNLLNLMEVDAVFAELAFAVITGKRCFVHTLRALLLSCFGLRPSSLETVSGI